MAPAVIERDDLKPEEPGAARDKADEQIQRLRSAVDRKKAQNERAAAIADAKSAGVLGSESFATLGNANGEGAGYGVGGGGSFRGGKGKPGQQVAKDQGGESAATRAWFPETFLFEPLVVTDDAGTATVRMRVPDRLTTWRVLALAHSRQGAQGGATTSFLGTLPTYVDLVVPKFLVIGDEIELPVQMINTTNGAVTSPLDLSVQGGVLAGGGGTRTIPAQGGLVEYAKLKANRAGTIQIKAGLGSTDAVVRTVAVRPAGRPETVTRAGTLAAPRTLTIEGPKGSDPETDRARLRVYPGALALLRSELGVSTARQGVADDAYALLLAGRATSLLAMLGDKPDPEAIRTLSIVTGQRAIRAGRMLDVERATLLAEAALAHPNNPVLARLGERAASYLAQNQRPDGTFAGGQGWTLQRVLVATADATRAVNSAHVTTTERHRAAAVAALARGAFERNVDNVQDGYTAAALLASHAVSSELAEKLREKVRAAIKAEPDGAKYLEVGEGVVRADGFAPTRVEATALAVLALDGDPDAPLADLGTTLLGAYSPERGWGDGRANLACMQAVLALFKTPVPEGVTITLLMDGTSIASGTLDREALREVLTLEAAAPGFTGAHEWQVVAEPAVPGLGFSLSLNGWVPWEKQTTQQGLEMSLTPGPVTATVGTPVELTLTAIAPSGTEVHVVQALPAGVQLDTPSLQALVDGGSIRAFEAADGKLELFINPLAPGQTFTAKYKAIPTLAGTLRSAASTISARGVTFSVPPTEWTIARASAASSR
jgi:uncharacterized protein YfaS (alpha-2-macroglobulin family)